MPLALQELLETSVNELILSTDRFAISFAEESTLTHNSDGTRLW